MIAVTSYLYYIRQTSLRIVTFSFYKASCYRNAAHEARNLINFQNNRLHGISASYFVYQPSGSDLSFPDHDLALNNDGRPDMRGNGPEERSPTISVRYYYWRKDWRLRNNSSSYTQYVPNAKIRLHNVKQKLIYSIFYSK